MAEAALPGAERLVSLAERCEMSARSRAGLGMTQHAIDDAQIAAACIRAVIAARELADEYSNSASPIALSISRQLRAIVGRGAAEDER